jgi:hypothetical protein
MTKISRLRSLVGLLVLVALLVAALPAPALAIDQSHPIALYGDVELNGVPAPVDTVVKIYLPGDIEPRAETTVTTAGEYGPVQLWGMYSDENPSVNEHGLSLSFTVDDMPANTDPTNPVFGWEALEIDLEASSGQTPSPTPTTTPSTYASDLMVADIWTEPAQFNAGDAVKIYTTIRNIGVQDAIGVFGIETYFDASPISCLNKDGLSSGKTYTFSHDFTWPSDTNWYDIKVIVDADGHIAETNEGNNEYSEWFKAGTYSPTLPTIYYSASSFGFTATEGGSDPSSQTLSIRNSGGGTLNWFVSDTVNWLTLSPTSGSSTGEVDAVTVSVDISGMAEGGYDDAITITASGAANSPQTVSVSLTINPSPTLTPTPTPTPTPIPTHTPTPTPTLTPCTLTTTYSPTGGGSVTPSGGTYTCGTAVTITATPSSGWSFDHWSGAASGTQNPITITMDSAKHVIAYFSSTATPTPTPPSFEGSGTVGTTAGTLTIGDFTMTYPAGAFTEDTEVTITNATCTGIPEGYKAGNSCFLITLDPATTTLGEEVTICVKYSDYDLTQANDDPSLLRLAYKDTAGEWQVLETEGGTESGTICADTNHLSVWGVFAKEGLLWEWWYYLLIALGVLIIIAAIVLLLVIPKRGEPERVPQKELSEDEFSKEEPSKKELIENEFSKEELSEDEFFDEEVSQEEFSKEKLSDEQLFGDKTVEEKTSKGKVTAEKPSEEIISDDELFRGGGY